MIYSILASFPALLNICLCPDYTQHSYLSKVHSTFLSVQNTPNSLLCPGYIQHSYTPRLYSNFFVFKLDSASFPAQAILTILPDFIQHYLSRVYLTFFCPGHIQHSSTQNILKNLLYPEYTRSSLLRIYSFLFPYRIYSFFQKKKSHPHFPPISRSLHYSWPSCRNNTQKDRPHTALQ